MVRVHPEDLDATTFTWDPWGTTGRTHCNCYDYAFDSYSSVRSAKSVPGDGANNPKLLANNLTFTKCNGIVKRVLGDNPRNVYKMNNPYAKCKPGFYKVMCFVAPRNDFGNSTGDFHWYKHNNAVRYRTRAGDKPLGLARFFRVPVKRITDAMAKATKPRSLNNGRIANSNNMRTLQSLNRNNEIVRTKSNVSMMPGMVLQFKVNLWSHKQGWGTGPQLVDANGKTIYDPIKAAKVYHPGFHYTQFCSAYAVRRGRANTGANSNRKNGKNFRSDPNFIIRQLLNMNKNKPKAKPKAKPVLRKRKVKNTKAL
jgi:hypothetical protein